MISCTFENGNKANLRHVCVDNLVLDDHKILLVKRSAKLSEPGKWGLVGGYMERDEDLLGCARREIMEETGYEVSDLNYLRVKDRPDRPAEERQNISFVYVCQAGKQTGIPDAESDEIKWFDLDHLPPKESFAFDHWDDISFYLGKQI